MTGVVQHGLLECRIGLQCGFAAALFGNVADGRLQSGGPFQRDAGQLHARQEAGTADSFVQPLEVVRAFLQSYPNHLRRLDHRFFAVRLMLGGDVPRSE